MVGIIIVIVLSSPSHRYMLHCIKTMILLTLIETPLTLAGIPISSATVTPTGNNTAKVKKKYRKTSRKPFCRLPLALASSSSEHGFNVFMTRWFYGCALIRVCLLFIFQDHPLSSGDLLLIQGLKTWQQLLHVLGGFLRRIVASKFYL